MNSINQKGKLSQGFVVKATYVGGLKTHPPEHKLKHWGWQISFLFAGRTVVFFGEIFGAHHHSESSSSLTCQILNRNGPNSNLSLMFLTRWAPRR